MTMGMEFSVGTVLNPREPQGNGNKSHYWEWELIVHGNEREWKCLLLFLCDRKLGTKNSSHLCNYRYYKDLHAICKYERK